MKLHEVVKKRAEKENQLKDVIKTFELCKDQLLSEISELKRLENIASKNIDIEKVLIAEKILYVSGDIYGKTSDVTKFNGVTIAAEAVIDISNNCEKLKKQYFGNKRYEGFYQRCDCGYGLGPRHGSIVDEISLKSEYRKVKDLTNDDKDACIYYLLNYNQIKDLKE